MSEVPLYGLGLDQVEAGVLRFGYRAWGSGFPQLKHRETLKLRGERRPG